MRKLEESTTSQGERRWKVRYRSGGVETSETFRRKSDAETFAAILGTGKADRVAEALQWLASKQSTEHTATFGEWFGEWLSQVTGVTKRTRADYEALHKRYLTSLDPLPLPLITRPHVARLVNELETKPRPPHGKPLSPKTIKHAINLLATVLSVAQDDGLIPRNPVKRVKLPKIEASDDQFVFLTADEAGRLVAATQEHYRPLVTFLLGTGLRWSEATALQVRHVDLAHGTVRVDRAWKRVPGGFEVGAPKSAKSRRTVNAAVAALLAVEPLVTGRKSTDLLFTTKTGGVVRHSNFYNRVWIPACERAGLTDPRPTPHDCRSTFGSWLISEGVGLEAVQDQLGHESYETTRKVYAHLLPAVGVAAGRAASAALARALVARDEVPDVGVRSLQAGADPDEPTHP
jgi:integrase